ncbi:MAG: EamA family transporter [Acidobacteriota bacterium]
MGGSTKRAWPGGLTGLVAFALFVIWSNTFIAIGFLLGAERQAARFDGLSLTVARFLPAALFCAVYCFGWHRREALALLRRHGGRLALCGLLVVPGYNLSLYFGQQHGVPAPVASLTTVLAPLFILVLSVIFLGERPTARKILGLAIALAGMALLAVGRPAVGGYSLLLAITALAPLAWSVYSVLAKPMTAGESPLLITFLAITLGTVPLLAVLPFSGGPEMLALDGTGWAAIAYLSLGATVLGFALWTQLLEFLPASTVGLTVFLNPPLTSISKAVLSRTHPETFSFVVTPTEWLGGGVTLLGLAVATVRFRRRANGPPKRPTPGP